MHGIAVAGYRSFAGRQEILLPTKVTVLAGINNSGKSNVLGFLQRFLPVLNHQDRLGNRASTPRLLSDLDIPRGFMAPSDFEVGVPIHLGGASTSTTEEIVRRALDQGSLEGYSRAVMEILSPGEPLFWARYSFDSSKGMFSPSSKQAMEAVERWPEWNDTASAMVGGFIRSRASDPPGVMAQLLASIPLPIIPPVATIASSRRVEAGFEGMEPEWSSGRGIIDALFKLQTPTYGEWESSTRSWQAINRFTQTVLGDPDAQLTVPHDRSTIQVSANGRVLPLSSLGSGVEQVVILAAAATVVSKHLVCVEEPETNLHPLLQKKLLRYLTEDTDNQYVIATHSSHFLDDSRATAYNVQLTETGTTLTLARRPHELVQICNDLGYRPSDLQQANCVIWVEGPSDRTYVRRWLELVEPDLAEGIDYSIMFYGGKLLSHLSTSEEALEQFISLRRLNRASTILIDSDKNSPDAKLNATKRRIQEEYLKDAPAPGGAWITAGYTIENYIPGEILTEAVSQVHPRISFGPVDKWTNPFPKRSGTQFDKIAISQAVADMLEPSHLDSLGLREKVQTLCDFIRAANGHSTASFSVS
ncbi:AAA family ATPase [Promicromonospora sp. CA-289599]|uniref:AAA family ATPase n=1 Tax=Promicromonospora sp. CA-289599 TaxID=3240014 RepID=UPI003D8BCF68